MTDQPADLFDAMDAAADAMRAADVSKDDLRIEFRRRQKASLPDLTDAQWLDLFDLWIDRYLGRLQAEMAATSDRLREREAERCALLKALPPGEPFRCVCGETGDPSDPEFERIHREHVFVAGLDKLTK